MTEQEKARREADMRKHRCCFIGHRPEKLHQDEAQVRLWLEARIREAIGDGFTTFITGMAMGADIWAGEIVVEIRREDPAVRLMAVTPYPTFAARWKDEWKKRYDALWAAADWRAVITPGFAPDAFRRRSEWLVDHAGRIIAYYADEPGGVRDTLKYAAEKGVPVVGFESRPQEACGPEE